MMDNGKPSTDFDDAEILAKFRSLLNKYQSQGKPVNAANTTVASTSMTVAYADEILREAGRDKVPTLTEVVMLRPSVIQPQPKRATPIQQILDAALEDANMEMDVIDRKALASALETRLTGQVK